MDRTITKDFCIVLYAHTDTPHSYTVFTRLHGKTRITVSSHFHRAARFHSGTLFAAVFYKQKGERFYVRDLENIMHPPVNTYKQLSWLHNLLEVSHYFSAPHDRSEELFDLLYHALRLCMHNQELHTNFLFVKRAYIVRLLILVGFYPGEEHLFLARFYKKFVSMPSLDLSDKLNISLVSCLKKYNNTSFLKSFDEWVFVCIKRHPQFHMFKTECTF